METLNLELGEAVHAMYVMSMLLQNEPRKGQKYINLSKQLIGLCDE